MSLKVSTLQDVAAADSEGLLPRGAPGNVAEGRFFSGHCVVYDVTLTYCGEHFTMSIKMESSC